MLLSIFQNEYVINAIGLVLAGAITYGFALLRAWATTKIKNAKVREAVMEASSIAEKAMLMIQQTFVEQLKKDDGFNKEKQEEAMYKAIREVKALTSEETKKIIEKNFGNFEVWTRMQVEAMINQLKEQRLNLRLK